MINLIVIYCHDIYKSKSFYECFGISFIKEKHGEGPIHFSSNLNGVIFELYPEGSKKITRIRLGLTIQSLDSIIKIVKKHFPKTTIKTIEFNNIPRLVITDPDGNDIEAVE